MTPRTALKLLLHVANFGLAAQGVPTFGGTDLVVDMMVRGERPLPGDAEHLRSAAQRLAGEQAGAWGEETVAHAIDLVRAAPLDPALVASAFARGADAASAAALLLDDLRLRLAARGDGAEVDSATANLLRRIFCDLYADNGALHALAATTLQRVARRLDDLDRAVRAGDAPPLALPREHPDGSGLHYANRTLPVLGREAVQARLRAFLDGEGDIRWFQLAGGAGQGKSRLALELCLERAGGWDVGFLAGERLARFERWHLWQPTAPTLIVLDYVTGWEEAVRAALDALLVTRRRFDHPVRLLLLERTPYRGAETAAHAAPWWRSLVAGHQALADALAATRFADGVLELAALGDDNLAQIVRRRGGGRAAPPAADEVRATLARIDGAGRPLYAYLLAEHLAAGAAAPTTRERLLDDALAREQRRFWRHEVRHLPTLVGDDPAMRLAVLATLARGVEAGPAVTALDPAAGNGHPQETIAEACRINGRPVLTADVTRETTLPPLQPDLLGEYLVLQALAPGFAGTATPATAALVQAAWRLAPEGTAQTLALAAQDFAHHPTLPALLKIPPEEPTGGTALAMALVPVTGHAANAVALPLTRAGIAAASELCRRLSGDLREPRLALTVAASNAAAAYGNAGDLAAMERARGELDAALAGFEDDREFRLLRVKGAAIAVLAYGRAERVDAVADALAELDAAVAGFESDAEFAAVLDTVAHLR
jgi:hypothetical protein